MLILYNSQKIKVISFACIILVLYIHSGFHDYPHEIAGMAFNHLLQDIISGQIGRCAVPMFYMISGFLFFQNVHTMGDIWKKMIKRVRTLLVPYVIAALFMPLFLVVLELFPFTSQFRNNTESMDSFQQPVCDIVLSLFYKVPGRTSPWAFHLWFLRDLIIIVALSPVLQIARKRIGGGKTVLLLFAATYCDAACLPFGSMFWFMAGDYMLSGLSRFKSFLWVVLFVVVSALELLFHYEFWTYLRIPIILTGIVSMWNLYDRLAGEGFDLNRHWWLSLACQFTFFVYLFHEPTLNIIRKLLLVPFGHTSFGFALDYLLSPWVFVVMFVALGYCMRKYLPTLYGICVGGR